MIKKKKLEINNNNSFKLLSPQKSSSFMEIARSPAAVPLAAH